MISFIEGKGKEKKRKKVTNDITLRLNEHTTHDIIIMCDSGKRGKPIKYRDPHCVQLDERAPGGRKGDAWMSQALLGNLLIEGHSERGSPQRHVSRLMKLNYMVAEWRLGRK